MRLGLVPESMEVEVEGIRFQFLAASEQDLVIAAAILENMDVAKIKPGSLDRGMVVSHVFGKLSSFTGEILVGDEPITVERLKELATAGRLQIVFTIKVTVGWAAEVLRSLGMFDQSEAGEKNA